MEHQICYVENMLENLHSDKEEIWTDIGVVPPTNVKNTDRMRTFSEK